MTYDHYLILNVDSLQTQVQTILYSEDVRDRPKNKTFYFTVEELLAEEVQLTETTASIPSSLDPMQTTTIPKEEYLRIVDLLTANKQMEDRGL